jgi:hypothetical protein
MRGGAQMEAAIRRHGFESRMHGCVADGGCVSVATSGDRRHASAISDPASMRPQSCSCDRSLHLRFRRCVAAIAAMHLRKFKPLKF